jgi:polyketide synthase PksN
VPVSAHTPTALDARLDRLADWLDGPGEAFSLTEIGYNLQVFREHRAVRAVFLARDRADLARQIRDRAPLITGDGEWGEPTGRYLAGEEVDWRALWPGAGCDRIPLPGYAFDRHRYWFTDVDTVYGDGAADPIRFQAVADGDAAIVRTTLTGQEFYLRDHLVNGRKVLPGVAYPEFGRRAAGGAGLPAGQIRDLRWLHPIEVNGSPVDVTIHFRREGGGHAFEFRSNPGAGELVHARGVLLPPPGGAGLPGRVDLDAVVATCPRTVPVAD